MSFQTSHIDMLKSKVTEEETTLSIFHISWDPAKNQYVFGLRFYYVKESQVCETIYFDNQTLGIITQRLPEVCHLLNTFNSHDTKPVKNSKEAYQLCNMALNPIDRRNWSACEIELDDP